MLTARELELLVALARREGGVATKAELLSEVWGFDLEGDDNIVEVYVRYLRTKIDRPFARNSLQTVRTIGYRLVDDVRVRWLARARGSVRLRVTLLAAGLFAVTIGGAAFVLLHALESDLVDDVRSEDLAALRAQAARLTADGVPAGAISVPASGGEVYELPVAGTARRIVVFMRDASARPRWSPATSPARRRRRSARRPGPTSCTPAGSR